MKIKMKKHMQWPKLNFSFKMRRKVSAGAAGNKRFNMKLKNKFKTSPGKVMDVPFIGHLSLGIKLAIINAVLIVVIIGGIFIIATEKANEIIQHEVMEKFTILSEKITDKVTLANNNVESFASIIAFTDSIKRYGDFINKVSPVDNSQQATDVLVSYVKANPTLLDGIFITDKNGIVTVDGAGGKYIGQGFIDRGFFQQGKGGKATWSDVYLSKLDQTPVKFFCIPFKDSKGSTAGTIMAVVKIDYINKLLDEIKIGKTGAVYLVDGKKEFVYHPDAEMRLKPISKMENSNLEASIANLAAGSSNQIKYTDKGDLRLCNYTPMGSNTLLVTISESEVLGPVNKLKITLAGFGALFILLGVISAVLASRLITVKVKKMQGLIHEVEMGNLTVEVNHGNKKRGDEIHMMERSLGAMIDSLRALVSDINEQSHTIKNSGEQLSQASDEGARAAQDISEKIQEMAVGTQEQTRFAEDTDRLVKDMIEQLKSVVTEMDRLVADANMTIESAKDGQVVIGKTINQMSNIKESSDQSLAVMVGLIHSSKLIGNITEVISSISNQTNLLALNAAIEAARAGDAGRGFAVVAEEIRKLASQSQESANNIGNIVKEIQTEIDKANEIIQNEGMQVSEGIKVIESTQTKFNEIIDKVHGTAETIMNVWGSISATESSGAEVLEAVEHISTIIQNMAANAQEVSASAQEQNAVSEEISASAAQLTSIAEDLTQGISRFKVN